MELLLVIVVAFVTLGAAVALIHKRVLERAQVMEWEQGLLFANGRFERVVGPGRYWLIKPFLGQELTTVDTRLVSVAVPGQEVLTKDKLPVRLTVIAQYRVADAKSAYLKAQSFGGLLYEELQLALRGLVGAQTLDGLLEGKQALSERLTELVKPAMAEFGIEVRACGVKDVVLPGELRGIYTKAVEAEKTAQTSLITARKGP